MKRYVIGVAVDQEREGKGQWMEYWYVSPTPAGVGRNVQFAAGMTAGSERIPAQWSASMATPGIYDMEFQPVQTATKSFLRLVAVEPIGPLPEDLRQALLALNPHKSA